MIGERALALRGSMCFVGEERGWDLLIIPFVCSVGAMLYNVGEYLSGKIRKIKELCRELF